MSMAEPKRSPKRKKSGEETIAVGAKDIIQQLPTLRRAKLEAVAAAAIQSSSEAAKAAAQCLGGSNDEDDSDDNHFQHCVRCHEDFDPDTAGPYDCTMEEHDENNGMIEVGRSGMEYIYPCCHQEDGGGPCWIGEHLVSWEEAEVTQIDRGYTHTKFNDGGYWRDQELVPKWKSHTNKSICFECFEDDERCPDCCTCHGKVEHHESTNVAS